MEITIQIRGVSKVFKTAKGSHVALQDVDLDIRKGEFISFIGHSGCGKSTLLNMIAGLSQVSDGSLLVNGTPVNGPGLDRAMVFQNYSLLPWLSVRENVYEAVDAASPNTSREEKMAAVDTFLKAVGLIPHADKKPGQLSGGMKQRVAIARAFAVHPQILILDEPFGALDALTKGALHDTLSALWKSEASKVETVLMVTHDIDEAIYLSDRIVVMSNGPAAKVSEIMEVNIARPRDKRSMTGSREYAALKTRLMDKLHAGHSMKSQARNNKRIRIGFMPLTDCAPLVLAHELGLFKKNGLEVELWKQPSWAAIRDKVLQGELQVAQGLFSLPLSVATGITEPRGAKMKIALNLSANGQAIVLSRALEDVKENDFVALREGLQQVGTQNNRKPTFAITYAGGTHDIWLRRALLEAGISLSEIEFVTLPPPQMVASLERGEIDGFSAGEPWPSVAIARGVGQVFARTSQIFNGFPEKVLLANEDFAAGREDDLKRLIKSTLEAAVWLERPDNFARASEILGRATYLNQSHASIETQLLESGFLFCGQNGFGLPQSEQVSWFLEQFVSCGLLGNIENSIEIAQSCILQAPFRDAARSLNLDVKENMAISSLQAVTA